MLILISHRGESRTPTATKMEIFLSSTNDFQPLTIVIKNFVLDDTGVLDPCDRLSIRDLNITDKDQEQARNRKLFRAGDFSSV